MGLWLLQLAINGRFLSQDTTGVQRMAREFTRALDRLIAGGHFPDLDVRLLVQSNADLSDLQLTAVNIEVLGGWRGHAWEQFVLPRHIRDAWLLNLGNTAPIISLLARKTVAVVVHDLSYRIFPGAYRPLYRLGHRLMDKVLMHSARLIFTVAETERAMIAGLYPAALSRIVVAQNGGWRDDAVARPENPRPRPAGGYGLYVGSFSRRKNVKVVIETAVALARSRGLRFKIVGASSPILQDIHMNLPADVRPLIELCGQVEDVAELEALYRGALFLLFPSFYEASALPPIEAMAQGCPVIVSDIPSLRERCRDAALYCDPYDPAAVLAATVSLLDQPELASDLVARGLNLAGRCSWRNQAISMITTIRECAA